MKIAFEMMMGSVFAGLTVAMFVLAFQDYIAGAIDYVEADLSDKLRRLRVSTTSLRRNLWIWFFVTVLTFAAVCLFLNSLIFGTLVAAFLTATPWYLVRRMAERRQEMIETQLADAMVSLANAVRAGLSLAQAMEILATQCPSPINSEFQQIVGEYKMGKPLEQTLTEARKRLRSENFALFAAALMASHKSGGRLNETVERIAESVLELQRLERKVIAETAQAKKSAVYMAMAPAIILVVYYFVDPVNTTMLFTKTAGQILLAGAVVLNVVAYLWARIILNPDL